MKKRILISVFDKTGIEKFAKLSVNGIAFARAQHRSDIGKAYL